MEELNKEQDYIKVSKGQKDTYGWDIKVHKRDDASWGMIEAELFEIDRQLREHYVDKLGG